MAIANREYMKNIVLDIPMASRFFKSLLFIGLGIFLLFATSMTCASAFLFIRIDGSPSADVIHVKRRSAVVLAGDGSDTVIGGSGGDDLNGNGGDDRLEGAPGGDTLHGGRGRDTLDGGPGDDWLYGDRGDDVLIGGPGADHFVIAPDGGRDLVTDFDGPAGDRIKVNGLAPPVIIDTADGAAVRLEDGSEIVLRGASRIGLEHWVEWRSTAALWPRRLGLAGTLLAVGLALWWTIRRRLSKAPPHAGGPLSAAAPTPTKPPTLEALLPHARDRSAGLDVMRAAAVLIVMGFHWSGPFLSWIGLPYPRILSFAGIFGVDLFFALSGFLIGQILLTQASAEPSGRNLGVFLIRRWMRTLPLYFAVIAALLWLAPPGDPPGPILLRFATLSQNLIGPMVGDGWFAVTWTLTIEEWFYVLFGIAAFRSFRTLHSTWAIWPPVAVFATIPLALRLFTGRVPQVWLMLDQIAYGVAMAQLFRTQGWPFRHPRASSALGVALLVAACLSVFILSVQVYDALVWSLTILGCALLLPAALKLRTLPRPTQRLVSAISAQSYALYLFHLPLMDAASSMWLAHRWPVWACVLFTVITPFPLAYLSFRFFESPILAFRPSHSPPRVRTQRGEEAQILSVGRQTLH